jgi:hypothetical protein
MKLLLKLESYSKDMKQISLLLLFLLTFIFGCKDTVPDAREFPIILTGVPKDIDETGATFQGELIQEGKMPATTYGFVWGIKDQMVESSNKIILTENPASNKFSIRIDHALAKDVEYKIRAFATTENITVYGNTISFTSKGSANNGWTIIDSSVNIGDPFYSSSDTEIGYVIHSNSKVDRFDPATNKFSGIADFPDMIYSLQFMSVASGTIQYLMYTNYSYLYKLAAGKWSIQSRIPFQSHLFTGYYQGLSVNNKIYILSSFQSYVYDPTTDVWQPKARLPIDGGSSNAGTTLNGKAYVITTDKNLWEYDPATDKWTIKTQYPGNLGDRLAAFSYSGKLYFGISSITQQSTQLVDSRLWSYDLTLNKWTVREEFPTDHIYGGLFSFFLKNNLYVGMENKGYNNNYTLWKYDPSKVVD